MKQDKIVSLNTFHKKVLKLGKDSRNIHLCVANIALETRKLDQLSIPS